MQSEMQAVSSTKQMFSSLEGDFITLGDLLQQIKSKKLFRIDGYTSFKECVELQFNTSTAFANKLLKVYNMFVVNMDMSAEDMTEIGFEKLLALYPILNKNDKWSDHKFVEEWMDNAHRLSLSELKHEVKNYKKEQKVIDVKTEVVDSGLMKVCEMWNVKKSELMFLLALGWLGTSDEDLKENYKNLKVLKRKFDEELEKPSGGN